MAEYKNNYEYFYVHLALIVHSFSINKLKNIFNITLSQFLKNDEEYNQKSPAKSLKINMTG